MTKVNEVSIQIEGSDQSLMTDLFSHKKFAPGYEIEIDKGISLRYESTTLREAIDLPPLYEITLVFAKDVLLPIVLGIVAKYIYDKIKDRSIKKFRIGDFEVAIDKDKIQEILLKEIKEKSIRETHVVNISIPEIPKHELLTSARSLSDRPITYDGKEMPYPDNKVCFAKYVSGKVETTLYIRDEKLNGIFHNRPKLYATFETAPTVLFRNMVFTRLISSSKKLPSGHEVEMVSQSK